MGRELYFSFVWCLLEVLSFCACLSYIGGGWVSGSIPRGCRIDRHWAGVDFFCLRSLGRTSG